VLLDFDDDADLDAGIAGPVDLERVVQLGEVVRLEFDVEHRSDDLDDSSDCAL
jgi:hypothetical protein